MEIRKVLYFINPKSGTSNNKDPRTVISNKMTERGISFSIHEIETELKPKKIKKIVESSEATDVIAAGGDGTINLIASEILGMNVNLGILPLGSANGLAYELGIPMNIDEALQVIINGATQPLDAVRINQKSISLHLSDLGMNARIIKGFEEEDKRGFINYFKHFLRVIKSPPSFRCYIEVGTRKFAHRSLMTVIANSGGYRTGAVINPTGSKNDGLFEVIILKPAKNWLLKNTVAAFRGNFHNQPNIETFNCTSATIKINPAQELQVDGELIGKTNEVKAEIIKHAFRVIVPL